MAMKKAKKTKRTHKWQARPNDAIRLAALRWFALELERIAIQIYATDRSRFSDMEGVLRSTLKQMARIHAGVSVSDDEDCPEGYIRCKDNTCAPSCDGVITAANSD